jgi:hypothetical protein
MDSALKGLFGGGTEGESRASSASDFAKRVAEGTPGEGYTGDEASGFLNDLIGHANSDQVKNATRSTLGGLSEDQRKEFGSFVGDLRQRSSGSRNGNDYSVDDISDLFGQAGGPAGGLDDFLGGIFGSGKDSSGQGNGGFDLGNLFNSGIGKLVFGGIAAFLTNELLGSKR